MRRQRPVAGLLTGTAAAPHEDGRARHRITIVPLGRIGRPDGGGEMMSGLAGSKVLVNNAGVYEEHRIDVVDYDAWQAAWRRTIDPNLIGAANVTFCAVRHMLGRGGRIVTSRRAARFVASPRSPHTARRRPGSTASGNRSRRHSRRTASLSPQSPLASSRPTWPPSSWTGPVVMQSAGRAPSTARPAPRRSPG